MKFFEVSPLRIKTYPYNDPVMDSNEKICRRRKRKKKNYAGGNNINSAHVTSDDVSNLRGCRSDTEASYDRWNRSRTCKYVNNMLSYLKAAENYCNKREKYFYADNSGYPDDKDTCDYNYELFMNKSNRINNSLMGRGAVNLVVSNQNREINLSPEHEPDKILPSESEEIRQLISKVPCDRFSMCDINNDGLLNSYCMDVNEDHTTFMNRDDIIINNNNNNNDEELSNNHCTDVNDNHKTVLNLEEDKTCNNNNIIESCSVRLENSVIPSVIYAPQEDCIEKHVYKCDLIAQINNVEYDYYRERRKSESDVFNDAQQPYTQQPIADVSNGDKYIHSNVMRRKSETDLYNCIVTSSSLLPCVLQDNDGDDKQLQQSQLQQEHMGRLQQSQLQQEWPQQLQLQQEQSLQSHQEQPQQSQSQLQPETIISDFSVSTNNNNNNNNNDDNDDDYDDDEDKEELCVPINKTQINNEENPTDTVASMIVPPGFTGSVSDKKGNSKNKKNNLRRFNFKQQYECEEDYIGYTKKFDKIAGFQFFQWLHCVEHEPDCNFQKFIKHKTLPDNYNNCVCLNHIDLLCYCSVVRNLTVPSPSFCLTDKKRYRYLDIFLNNYLTDKSDNVDYYSLVNDLYGVDTVPCCQHRIHSIIKRKTDKYQILHEDKRNFLEEKINFPEDKRNFPEDKINFPEYHGDPQSNLLSTPVIVHNNELSIIKNKEKKTYSRKKANGNNRKYSKCNRKNKKECKAETGSNVTDDANTVDNNEVNANKSNAVKRVTRSNKSLENIYFNIVRKQDDRIITRSYARAIKDRIKPGVKDAFSIFEVLSQGIHQRTRRKKKENLVTKSPNDDNKQEGRKDKMNRGRNKIKSDKCCTEITTESVSINNNCNVAKSFSFVAPPIISPVATDCGYNNRIQPSAQRNNIRITGRKNNRNIGKIISSSQRTRISSVLMYSKNFRVIGNVHHTHHYGSVCIHGRFFNRLLLDIIHYCYKRQLNLFSMNNSRKVTKLNLIFFSNFTKIIINRYLQKRLTTIEFYQTFKYLKQDAVTGIILNNKLLNITANLTTSFLNRLFLKRLQIRIKKKKNTPTKYCNYTTTTAIAEIDERTPQFLWKNITSDEDMTKVDHEQFIKCDCNIIRSTQNDCKIDHTRDSLCGSRCKVPELINNTVNEVVSQLQFVHRFIYGREMFYKNIIRKLYNRYCACHYFIISHCSNEYFPIRPYMRHEVNCFITTYTRDGVSSGSNVCKIGKKLEWSIARYINDNTSVRIDEQCAFYKLMRHFMSSQFSSMEALRDYNSQTNSVESVKNTDTLNGKAGNKIKIYESQSLTRNDDFEQFQYYYYTSFRNSFVLVFLKIINFITNTSPSSVKYRTDLIINIDINSEIKCFIKHLLNFNDSLINSNPLFSFTLERLAFLLIDRLSGTISLRLSKEIFKDQNSLLLNIGDEYVSDRGISSYITRDLKYPACCVINDDDDIFGSVQRISTVEEENIESKSTDIVKNIFKLPSNYVWYQMWKHIEKVLFPPYQIYKDLTYIPTNVNTLAFNTLVNWNRMLINMSYKVAIPDDDDAPLPNSEMNSFSTEMIRINKNSTIHEQSKDNVIKDNDLEKNEVIQSYDGGSTVFNDAPLSFNSKINSFSTETIWINKNCTIHEQSSDNVIKENNLEKNEVIQSYDGGSTVFNTTTATTTATAHIPFSKEIVTMNTNKRLKSNNYVLQFTQVKDVNQETDVKLNNDNCVNKINDKKLLNTSECTNMSCNNFVGRVSNHVVISSDDSLESFDNYSDGNKSENETNEDNISLNVVEDNIAIVSDKEDNTVIISGNSESAHLKLLCNGVTNHIDSSSSDSSKNSDKCIEVINNSDNLIATPLKLVNSTTTLNNSKYSECNGELITTSNETVTNFHGEENFSTVPSKSTSHEICFSTRICDISTSLLVDDLKVNRHDALMNDCNNLNGVNGFDGLSELYDKSMVDCNDFLDKSDECFNIINNTMSGILNSDCEVKCNNYTKSSSTTTDEITNEIPENVGNDVTSDVEKTNISRNEFLTNNFVQCVNTISLNELTDKTTEKHVVDYTSVEDSERNEVSKYDSFQELKCDVLNFMNFNLKNKYSLPINNKEYLDDEIVDDIEKEKSHNPVHLFSIRTWEDFNSSFLHAKSIPVNNIHFSPICVFRSETLFNYNKVPDNDQTDIYLSDDKKFDLFDQKCAFNLYLMSNLYLNSLRSNPEYTNDDNLKKMFIKLKEPELIKDEKKIGILKDKYILTNGFHDEEKIDMENKFMEEKDVHLLKIPENQSSPERLQSRYNFRSNCTECVNNRIHCAKVDLKKKSANLKKTRHTSVHKSKNIKITTNKGKKPLADVNCVGGFLSNSVSKVKKKNNSKKVRKNSVKKSKCTSIEKSIPDLVKNALNKPTQQDNVPSGVVVENKIKSEFLTCPGFYRSAHDIFNNHSAARRSDNANYSDTKKIIAYDDVMPEIKSEPVDNEFQINDYQQNLPILTEFESKPTVVVDRLNNNSSKFVIGEFEQYSHDIIINRTIPKLINNNNNNNNGNAYVEYNSVNDSDDIKPNINITIKREPVEFPDGIDDNIDVEITEKIIQCDYAPNNVENNNIESSVSTDISVASNSDVILNYFGDDTEQPENKNLVTILDSVGNSVTDRKVNDVAAVIKEENVVDVLITDEKNVHTFNEVARNLNMIDRNELEIFETEKKNTITTFHYYDVSHNNLQLIEVYENEITKDLPTFLSSDETNRDFHITSLTRNSCVPVIEEDVVINAFSLVKSETVNSCNPIIVDDGNISDYALQDASYYWLTSNILNDIFDTLMNDTCFRKWACDLFAIYKISNLPNIREIVTEAAVVTTNGVNSAISNILQKSCFSSNGVMTEYRPRIISAGDISYDLFIAIVDLVRLFMDIYSAVKIITNFIYNSYYSESVATWREIDIKNRFINSFHPDILYYYSEKVCGENRIYERMLTAISDDLNYFFNVRAVRNKTIFNNSVNFTYSKTVNEIIRTDTTIVNRENYRKTYAVIMSSSDMKLLSTDFTYFSDTNGRNNDVLKLKTNEIIVVNHDRNVSGKIFIKRYRFNNFSNIRRYRWRSTGVLTGLKRYRDLKSPNNRYQLPYGITYRIETKNRFDRKYRFKTSFCYKRSATVKTRVTSDNINLVQRLLVDVNLSTLSRVGYDFFMLPIYYRNLNQLRSSSPIIKGGKFFINNEAKNTRVLNYDRNDTVRLKNAACNNNHSNPKLMSIFYIRLWKIIAISVKIIIHKTKSNHPILRCCLLFAKCSQKVNDTFQHHYLLNTFLRFLDKYKMKGCNGKLYQLQQLLRSKVSNTGILLNRVTEQLYLRKNNKRNRKSNQFSPVKKLSENCFDVRNTNIINKRNTNIANTDVLSSSSSSSSSNRLNDDCLLASFNYDISKVSYKVNTSGVFRDILLCCGSRSLRCTTSVETSDEDNDIRFTNNYNRNSLAVIAVSKIIPSGTTLITANNYQMVTTANVDDRNTVVSSSTLLETIGDDNIGTVNKIRDISTVAKVVVSKTTDDEFSFNDTERKVRVKNNSVKSTGFNETSLVNNVDVAEDNFFEDGNISQIKIVANRNLLTGRKSSFQIATQRTLVSSTPILKVKNYRPNNMVDVVNDRWANTNFIPFTAENNVTPNGVNSRESSKLNDRKISETDLRENRAISEHKRPPFAFAKDTVKSACKKNCASNFRAVDLKIKTERGIEEKNVRSNVSSSGGSVEISKNASSNASSSSGSVKILDEDDAYRVVSKISATQMSRLPKLLDIHVDESSLMFVNKCWQKTKQRKLERAKNVTKCLAGIHKKIEIFRLVLQECINKRNGKLTDRDNSLLRRVALNILHAAYLRALNIYPTEQIVWTQYLKFCSVMNFVREAVRTLKTYITKLNGTPFLVHFAACWSYNCLKRPALTEYIIQKALSRHTNNSLLYTLLFYLKLERARLIVEKSNNMITNCIRSKRKHNYLEPARTVYYKASKNINCAYFQTNMLDIVIHYPFASSLQKLIASEGLWKFSFYEQFWIKISKYILRGYGLIYRTHSNRVLPSISKRIKSCFRLLFVATKKFNSASFWKYYVDLAADICDVNICVPTSSVFSRILSAFADGHSRKRLTKRHYLSWLDNADRYSDKSCGGLTNREVVTLKSKILMRFISMYPNEHMLWTTSLRCHLICDNSVVVKIMLSEATYRLAERSYSLFLDTVSYYMITEMSQVRELLFVGTGLPYRYAEDIRQLYLHWLFIMRGLKATLTVFDKLCADDYGSCRLYVTIIQLEMRIPNFSIVHVRTLFERGLDLYARTNVVDNLEIRNVKITADSRLFRRYSSRQKIIGGKRINK